MKIIEINELSIPDVKVIEFQRFSDERGYFTETFKESDFLNNEKMTFLKNYTKFPQCNESFSKKGVIRGLHVQWNPFQGKLVRVISGKIIDFALDIRNNSQTKGKIVGHELSSNYEKDKGEWIWVPVGFAHGFVALEDTTIEYFCTGEYSPGCEAGISPFAKDIDWSLCDEKVKKLFDEVAHHNPLISEKDKNAQSLSEWFENNDSEKFSKE